MSARLTVESIKQTAINFPDDNLFIQCDGMDNAKVVLNPGFHQCGWIEILEDEDSALFVPFKSTFKSKIMLTVHQKEVMT